MIGHFDFIPESSVPAQYKMLRGFSNSNPSLQQLNRIPNGIPDGGLNHINHNPSPPPNNNVQVEYEVSVPVVPSYRHTPYHSLWNLNQGFVYNLNDLLLFEKKKLQHLRKS